MHPRAEVLGLSIRCGPALYVVAVASALAWALRRGDRFGFPPRTVLGQFLVFGICFVVGCPLYYAASHWGQYSARPLAALRFWQEGSAQYGGVILWLTVMALWLCPGNRFYRALATWTPPFLLAVIVGRLGCFLGGCCFGLPTKSVFGVTYPEWGTPCRIGRRLVEAGAAANWRYSADHSAIVPYLHPTQIYAAAAAAAILLGIRLAERRGLPARAIVLYAWAAYAAMNLIVERFRYFAPDTYRLGIPLNSWVSVALLAGSALLLTRGEQSRQQEAAQPWTARTQRVFGLRHINLRRR